MGYPRFSFDNRFDEREPEPPPGPSQEPPPDPLDLPAHSERALRAAVAAAELQGFTEGVEQGRADGLKEAAALIEADTARALEQVEDALGALARGLAGPVAAVEARGAAAVAALVRRLAPWLLEAGERSTVERLALDALGAALKSPVLRVRVAPDLAPAIEARLSSVAGACGFAGHLEVAGDPGCPRGAVHAEWAAGSLSFDPAEIERAVAELADRALATAHSTWATPPGGR